MGSYAARAGAMALEAGSESVLALRRPTRQLPAETARWSTITQIYEGTNQIQRIVMARQLLHGNGRLAALAPIED